MKPLQGKQILVTRPEGQSKTLADELEKLGAEIISMPVIKIVEPDSWQEFDQAINNLSTYDWIIFASSNAVTSFINRKTGACNAPLQVLPQQPTLHTSDEKNFPKIAVIGEMTANTASQQGLAVDYYPDKYLAEDFIAQFPGYPNLACTNILWPRTNIGRNFILDKLQAAGATIHVVPAYKSVLPENAQELSKQLNQLLINKKLDIITLTSKQTAINLSRIISLNLDSPIGKPLKQQAEQLRDILSTVLIVTIGPQTSEGALNYLGKTDLEANPHTNKGMLAALITYYEDKKNG